MLASFSSELQKIAYSPEAHAELAGVLADKMHKEMSPGVRAAIVGGAVQADYGVRFPLLPWTDELHSFPTQEKPTILSNIEKKKDQGVQDVAKAIALDGASQGARAFRGLKNIGEASHMIADLGAHFEKPDEMGAAIPYARKTMKYLLPAYGGGWESLVEHLRVGYKLDHLDPKTSDTDRHTIMREKAFAKDVVRSLKDELREKYEMGRLESRKKVDDFLSNFNPTLPEKILGEVVRTGTYLGQQAARAGRAIARTHDRLVGLPTEELPKK